MLKGGERKIKNIQYLFPCIYINFLEGKLYNQLLALGVPQARNWVGEEPEWKKDF